MKNPSPLSVGLFFVGLIMLYGAVKNKHPLHMIQLALQGKSPAEARPIDPD